MHAPRQELDVSYEVTVAGDDHDGVLGAQSGDRTAACAEDRLKGVDLLLELEGEQRPAAWDFARHQPPKAFRARPWVQQATADESNELVELGGGEPSWRCDERIESLQHRLDRPRAPC
jgi:hypothetical protein